MIRIRVPALPRSGRVALPHEAAHHAVRVRRLAEGDPVLLFDGAGAEVPAMLVRDGDDWAAELTEPPRPGRTGADLTLCYGLPRGEKLDAVVRQATELGVGRVVLLATERSVVRLSPERARKRLDRLARVAADAARQCGRADVPDLGGPLTVEVAATQHAEPSDQPAGSRWVLHPEGGSPLTELVAEAPLTLCVGPEGGFSPDELDVLEASGFLRVTLGGPVLRTETAATVACALALHRLGVL